MIYRSSLSLEGVACRALTSLILARKAEAANGFIIGSVSGIQALIRKWFSQHVDAIGIDSHDRALTELIACYSRHILAQDVFFRQMAWDTLTRHLMPNPNGVDVFSPETIARLPVSCTALAIIHECQELPTISFQELAEIKSIGCYADKMAWIKELFPSGLTHADKMARYALVGHVYLE